MTLKGHYALFCANCVYCG